MLQVLLVDDEPFIVQGLSMLIDWNYYGFEIAKTAANGKEALEFLRGKKIDLIITDIKMPEMSGFELLETVKKEELSDAYFVILSGYSDFSYTKQAIRYDCMDYILKPVQQEELLEVLQKVASLHQSSEQKKKEDFKKQKAYLSRNVISILSGKYDQINVDYAMKYMCLSDKMRYIDIEIDEQALPKELAEEEKRNLQRRLYQHCMDYLGESCNSHCIFDVVSHEQGYDIGFLYCSHMAEDGQMTEQQFLDHFINALNLAMKVPILMFVGKCVENIRELSDSFRTAAVVKSFRDFSQSKIISYYDEGTKKSHDGIVLCKQSLDDLVQSVEQNQPEAINQNTEKLYTEMNKLGMDARLVDLNISYLLFQLIHLASEQDDHVNQEEIMHHISANAFDRGTMRGSEKHLRRFAQVYSEYLAQLRKNVSRGVLCDIEKEVKDNYTDNLTLKELGKKYYINSAYLGQIFRKKYGQSFKDYLNNYRVEQAASMLLRTGERVYEIAEKVGYHDLDYFINRFIAVKGCTPAKFRKQSKE